MGAVAVSNRVDRVTADGRRAVEATVTMSSSYATGGDTLALSALGLGEVREAWVKAHGTPAASYRAFVDVTDPKAPKVLLYSNSAQVTAATNVSTASFVVRLVGS